MTTRRDVIDAIAVLTPDQRAQMLLYLLGDDWAALEVIDRRKWAYQEYKPWHSYGGDGPLVTEQKLRDGASSGGS